MRLMMGEFELAGSTRIWATAFSAGVLLLFSTGATSQPGHIEGVFPSGIPYQVTVPENWNGIVINDLDSVTDLKGPLATYLLGHGYAYSGTGRDPARMQRHDPLAELDAQSAVIDLLKSTFGTPKQTIQYGCSGGGFIALAMAEVHPEQVNGVVAFNARGSGGLAVANLWLDLPFALKALLAPNSDLLVAPIPEAARANALVAWRAMLEKAQQTPEGRARIALAVTLAQWPTWASSDWRPPAKPVKGDLASFEQAMFRSASDGISSAVNRRQLYDNPQGLASWNTGIDYARFYRVGGDPEQKAVVNQLYQAAGLGGEAGVAADLKRINAYPRIEGTKAGINYWLTPGRLLSSDIKVPMLHIHGLGDALLPPHLTAGYAVAVKDKGKGNLYRQGFIDAAGHCATNVSEAMAAIDAMTQRIGTGSWGDTSAEALNKAGRSLGTQEPRFVSYEFATPFNRAFYPGDKHP